MAGRVFADLSFNWVVQFQWKAMLHGFACGFICEFHISIAMRGSHWILSDAISYPFDERFAAWVACGVLFGRVGSSPRSCPSQLGDVMPIETTHNPPDVPVDEHDEFVFPWNIFESLQDAAVVSWTCVRSRPRWEKKLCRLLRSRMIPHYMPVVSRQTYSGRKLRDSLLPLFPGFVFVKGNHTKGAFKDTGCVASVLNPASQLGIEALDGQIRSVHRMLALGRPVDLTTKYEVGEKLTIDSGPLRGISGTVTSTANTKRLVLWVDMLGVGAAVELGCDTILAKAGVVQPRSFQQCSAGPTG